MKGVMGQQNRYLTVIVVHSAMTLMHHYSYQITIICVYMYMYGECLNSPPMSCPYKCMSQGISGGVTD